MSKAVESWIDCSSMLVLTLIQVKEKHKLYAEGLCKVDKRKPIVKALEILMYLLPALLFFAVFTYYPFAKTIYTSFFLSNSMGQIREFVGLENYVNVLTNSAFLKAIRNTLFYVAISVPSYVIIALILALIANKKTRTSSIYEMMFSLTMAMSMSVSAMIFQLLFNPTIGAINHILKSDINWLNDPRYAMFAIAVISVWMNIGYHFLFLLAGIRSVPDEIMESAQLEGANIFQKTIKIILPLISPVVFFLITSSLAKNMLMSGLTLVLTQGGPQGSTETVISFMYKQAVNNFNYNDAYAAAVISFLITLALILIGFKFEKKGVHYS